MDFKVVLEKYVNFILPSKGSINPASIIACVLPPGSLLAKNMSGPVPP
jgi:hypothetical protein